MNETTPFHQIGFGRWSIRNPIQCPVCDKIFKQNKYMKEKRHTNAKFVNEVFHEISSFHFFPQ